MSEEEMRNGGVNLIHLKSDFRAELSIKIILAIFLLSLSVTGCISPGRIYKKVSTGIGSLKNRIHKKHPEGLKKKAVFYPLINNAGLDASFINTISDELIRLIEDQSPVIIKKADIKPSFSRNLNSPEFGISIDTDLAKQSEELGMNIMIAGVLNPLEVDIKKRGIWPFKKPYREITASILINVVNLQNGTLLLSNLETKTIKEKIKEGQESQKTPANNKKILEKALEELIKKQAEKIAEAIADSPWSARIITTENRYVIINAGKDVGLTPDQVIEVYSRGEPISSAEGRRLFLLGEKVGELKVVSVDKTFARAVPLNGRGFKPGQVVRLKD